MNGFNRGLSVTCGKFTSGRTERVGYGNRGSLVQPTRLRFRPRSIGICGSALRVIVRTIPRMRHTTGADGGTSERVRWEIWVATSLIIRCGRSILVRPRPSNRESRWTVRFSEKNQREFRQFSDRRDHHL